MSKINLASALKMAFPAHGKQVYSARPTRSYPEMSVLSRAKKYKEGIMTKKELKAIIRALNEAIIFNKFEIEEAGTEVEVRSASLENLIHLYQLLSTATIGNVMLMRWRNHTATDYLKVYFQ